MIGIEHDLVLYADHDRLSQVFSNLLNNAAKYSAADTPIELAASTDGAAVEVSIADHGIGLEADRLDDIFEAFAQIDTSLERARGGLGIGLTLVKRIVELHGGAVHVHSDGLGHGSRFTVVLPIEVVPEMAADAPPVAAELSPAPCRALVVDDNRDSADTLAAVLQLLGHATRCVYDPQRTIDAVRAFDPDIVFLDIGMPGLSGYDVARTLRAEHDPRIVLVAVTGWGHADDRRRTAEAGFDHHLVKPAEMAAITEICARLTSRRTA